VRQSGRVVLAAQSSDHGALCGITFDAQSRPRTSKKARGHSSRSGRLARRGADHKGSVVLRINDEGRVRVITLDRPAALNAFNEALYDAAAEALIDAASASHVAVVVLTGIGRAFSAGTDVTELAARTTDPTSFRAGVHGFPGFVGQLAAFPKPLVCAVNGLALGIGASLLAHRDLIAAARKREDLAFSRLLGQPANLEALAALSERRCPDFAAVDAANPPDLERHRAG
jgi:Enoyl-CoA hydratase/isomerase